MEVLQALPEDARSVATIHVDAWRSAYGSVLSPEYLDSLSVEEREAMWSERIAAGASTLLVVKADGVAIGFLSFGAPRDGEAPQAEAELWALYVAPSSWSTGAGRMLWLRARELMLAQGFTSCGLWVLAQNARAIKFYRAAGFVRDPSPPRSFELGGKQLEEVRFVSRLDEDIAGHSGRL